MSKKAASVTPAGCQTFDALYPGVSQAVAYSTVSAQSAAVGATTTVVQVTSTTVAFVAIGTNPTAAANAGAYLPAGVPVKFACNPGDKIAVIRSAADGTLYITEGA